MMRSIDEIAYDLAQNKMAFHAYQTTNVYGATPERLAALEALGMKIAIDARRLNKERDEAITALSAPHASPEEREKPGAAKELSA